MDSLPKAGGISQETMSTIWTVHAFGAEKKLQAVFDHFIDQTRTFDIKFSRVLGAGMACLLVYRLLFVFIIFLLCQWDDFITQGHGTYPTPGWCQWRKAALPHLVCARRACLVWGNIFSSCMYRIAEHDQKLNYQSLKSLHAWFSLTSPSSMYKPPSCANFKFSFVMVIPLRMKLPIKPSSIDCPWTSQATTFSSATSKPHRSECISPGAESCVQTNIQLSSFVLSSSITRKQCGVNPSGCGRAIFASNQSRTSSRERPRKAVGDEATGREDPLVIVAISLVSMMTSRSDTCAV